MYLHKREKGKDCESEGRRMAKKQRVAPPP